MRHVFLIVMLSACASSPVPAPTVAETPTVEAPPPKETHDQALDRCQQLCESGNAYDGKPTPQVARWLDDSLIVFSKCLGRAPDRLSPKPSKETTKQCEAKAIRYCAGTCVAATAPDIW